MGSRKNRVLEIDGQPPHLPSDISKVIAPELAELREKALALGITIRAGESFDAEFPSNHSSYFVLVGFQEGVTGVSAAVEEIVTALIQFCNQNRLPIIEIPENHPELKTTSPIPRSNSFVKRLSCVNAAPD